jgi:hypothetical protein
MKVNIEFRATVLPGLPIPTLLIVKPIPLDKRGMGFLRSERAQQHVRRIKQV